VSAEFEPVIASREPLATDIVRQLLDHLLEGRLGAGDKLPSERSLAGTMRVGRSVVREALRTLTLLGLIEVRQGDGNYIKSTESDVLPTVIEWGLLLGARQTEDLVEARCHLEVLVAGLAAERRNEDNLHDLQRAISRMWAAGSDAEKYAEADIAFHQRISLAARNETLHRVMLSIQSLLRVWIPRVMQREADFEPTIRQHVRVMEAIEAGDPERSRQAMSDHMDSAAARLMLTLDRSEVTSTPS